MKDGSISNSVNYRHLKSNNVAYDSICDTGDSYFLKQGKNFVKCNSGTTPVVTLDDIAAAEPDARTA